MFVFLEFFNFFIQFALTALFCYHICDAKNGKIRAVLIYSFCMFLLYIFTFYKITPNFKIERYILPVYARTFFSATILFLFNHLALKASIKRSICITILFYIIAFFFERIVIFIVRYVVENRFSINEPEGIYDLTHYRVFALSLCSVMFFGFFYVIIILNSNFVGSAKRRLISLLIILSLSEIIILSGLYSSDNSAISTYGAAFTIAMLVVDIILFNLIEYFNDLVEQETEVVKLNSERENLYNYYKLTQDKANEVSKIKHDLKNQIQTAILLLEDNEKASQSINFLSKIDAKINDVDRVTYCSNQIINTVLSIKSAEAKKYGITSNIKISNIDNITIDDIDLSSIFSNLYDNSIEALKNTDIIDKYIDISVLASKGYLVIRFINPINKNIKVYNKNRVETTKQDKENHGFGLKQINSIAKKYYGDVEILADNNKFQITLHLKM